MQRYIVIFLVFALASATSAFAGWTVTYLHPTGSAWPWSELFGISGAQQVGSVSLRGVDQHAGLWNGTTASFVDLNPAGSAYSHAYGVSDGLQAGSAGVSGTRHAGVWSGTADSFADLNPPTSTWSEALGITGLQQVGYARFGGISDHAALWHGSAESFVDLSPAHSDGSRSLGVSDGQQVGHAVFDGYAHAGLWSGTRESWVDLHPIGVTHSCGLGISGGQQVGYVNGTSFYSHAALWNGTATSFVDLNPAGVSRSRAMGVSRGYQVGFADSHAGMWSGTAGSWFNLHEFLDLKYSSSLAESIEVTESDIWVVGEAWNSVEERYEAIMWHNVVPEPSSLLALGSGLVALGGLVRRRRR